MTPEELAVVVRGALAELAARGEVSITVPDEVHLERPRNRDHGDYATNVALTLAKQSGMAPRDLATALAAELTATAGIDSAEIAGPGFVNIRLDNAAQGELARGIVTAGETYGTGTALAGRTVNVEFISANPTGPLHLGHTRWAAVGDAIARVLAAAGADVAKEFYINDRGVQMDKFGASVMAAAHGRPIPEDGYHGGYILDLAAEIIAAEPSITELPEEEQLIAFREAAYGLQLRQQQSVLRIFHTCLLYTSDAADE